MSNATNVTHNVFSNITNAEPSIVINVGQLGSDSSTLVVFDKTAAVTILDSTTNKTYTTDLVPSGMTSTNQLNAYAYGIDDTINSVLNGALNIQIMTPIHGKYSTKIATMKPIPLPVTNFNLDSLPIVTIGGYSILTFNEWISMFNFDGMSNDTISTIKGQLSTVYPQTLQSSSDSAFNQIIAGVKQYLLSGYADVNDIVDILTSSKLSTGNFIDPNKVYSTKYAQTIPYGELYYEFSISATSGIADYTINLASKGWDWKTAMNFANSFSSNQTNGYLSYTQNNSFATGFPSLWGSNWDGFNSKLYVTQPTSTSYQTVFQNLGFNGVIPTLDGKYAPFGNCVSAIYTAAYASSSNSNSTNPPSYLPNVPVSSSYNSLFSSVWYSTPSLNQFSAYAFTCMFPGGNISSTYSGYLVPYFLPGIDVTKLDGHNSANVPMQAAPFYGTTVGCAFMLQPTMAVAGWQNIWVLPSANMYSCFNDWVTNAYQAFSEQASELGYVNPTAEGVDSNGPYLYYQYDIAYNYASNVLSVESMPVQQIHYLVFNLDIDVEAVIKEVEAVEKDPFEAVADKILSLRNEFAAKILSDVDCKIMNLPTAEDGITNFSSTWSTVQKLGNSVPTQEQVYGLLFPIFLGALNLGTLISVIDDSYTLWPYKTIPSSFYLAWENITNTYNWSVDFPFSPHELSYLMSWFYIYPSPTSVKATATQTVTYKLNPEYHIFRTTDKPVTKNLPKHSLMMLLDKVDGHFDPSIKEIKLTMSALDDAATIALAASTGYSSAKSAESMLNGILKRNNLASVEDMVTSNDPTIKDLYNKLSQWWTGLMHAKSNGASSQSDHYDHKLFLPSSEEHKKALERHRGGIQSIMDAVTMSTFHNSDIVQQVGQLTSNTILSHKQLLMHVFSKLGTDLLVADSLKLVDKASMDIVHMGEDIGVDIGKAILNLASDVFEGAADLVSPVSVVTDLYNDLNEHLFNDFSQAPDIQSTLFDGSANEYTPWSIWLTSFSNAVIYSNNQWAVTNNSALSPSGATFKLGGMVPNSASGLTYTIQTTNDSLGIPVRYLVYSISDDNAKVSFPIFKIKVPSDATKPVRYKFHTTVGDAYLYAMFGMELTDGQWLQAAGNTSPNSVTCGGLFIEPIPVKSDVGVINPLLTYKKLVQIIYQLPRLFGCSGLFNYDYYRDLWQSFISAIGSEAWANDQPHISMTEEALVASAGLGMTEAFTAYGVVEGLSLNWAGAISDGVVALTDGIETGEYLNKAQMINSEPNILSNQTQVSAFLGMVMQFIFDWKYAMSGGLTTVFTKYPDYFNAKYPGLVQAYNDFMTLTLDPDHKNTRLCEVLNDYFYQTSDVMFPDWSCSTIPFYKDNAYYVNAPIYLDLDLDSHLISKQVANVKYTSEGLPQLMLSVYSPSILRDFMCVTAGLGRIAAGAFLEKRVAKFFYNHMKRGNTLMAIRAKIKNIGKAVSNSRETKLGKWLGKVALAKYHRKHNSEARAKLINSQTATLESTLTQQTNTLAGDISGVGSKDSLIFGLH